MFADGARVRVLEHSITGHCRTPLYLKGKVGEVISLAGAWRDPETLAYHKPGLPKRNLYRVRFRQVDLWHSYSNPGDTLEADLYEHWLAPADDQDTGDLR